MKYVIIYAHPNERSFNHAIKEAIEANLRRTGKNFLTRDLYAIGFKPALQAADFIAMSKDQLLPDVEAEQQHIKDADRIIIVHPIWWFNMPAVLKGYIDRVFSRGFAYDYKDGGLVGLLPGKDVMIFNTTGGSAEDYEKNGFNGALKLTIDTGVFGICGMKVVKHRFFYAIPTSTDEERKAILAEFSEMNL